MTKVRNIEQAWKEADRLFPTDYEEDALSTQRAGYTIYKSTAEGNDSWISDLGNRLELNIWKDGHCESTNIWIEEEPKMSVIEFMDRYISMRSIISLCEENGDINYTGLAMDAPYWAITSKDFIRVEGLGNENDLVIITRRRNS